ncbi:DUF2437 domain-containing protein [SAR202 cluster bacterium AD-804-J14_MRT_500m]|nr:DUF2437 domain-containing protein [SAR202 cluster bacterium AD-804-J14_MRT_500m]
MRFCRFISDDVTSYGIVDGEYIVEIQGTPFGPYQIKSVRRRLEDTTLLVPFVPKTFYAAGLNYLSHITETAESRGEEVKLPDKPDIGYRANNALIGHNEPIVIPANATNEVQYEGELVVVIGKEAKHLSEDDALSCVLGYTIGNDVSERSWQRSDRTMWRSKNTDTFKPMGPWIETDALLDAMRTTVRLNGEEVYQFATNDMLFGVERYISTMTKNLTLYPGDAIWMGTDGPTLNMKHGDQIEVEITGIGTLRNQVVRSTI